MMDSISGRRVEPIPLLSLDAMEIRSSKTSPDEEEEEDEEDEEDERETILRRETLPLEVQEQQHRRRV